MPITTTLRGSISFWSRKPSSKAWVALPIGYMIILQVLTGLPKPESLRKFDSNEFIVRFSEELFDYPFWLQDLSHLPLFFGLAWLWSWFLGSPAQLTSAISNKALLLSLGYGFFNELIQAFIPQRFPSVGDLVMNTCGVALGIYFHSLLCRSIRHNRGREFGPQAKFGFKCVREEYGYLVFDMPEANEDGPRTDS